MTITIRLLKTSDARGIQSNCFPESSLDEIAERVAEDVSIQRQGEGETLVAVEDDRVGATAKLLKHGMSGWICNVSSHSDFRGRGIMQQLFKALEKDAAAMGISRLSIHVRADNARARRAYEKAGFKYACADGMRGAQLRYEKELNCNLPQGWNAASDID